MIVLLIGLSIPRLWHVQGERGPGRVVGICLGLGAGIGLLLAVAFAIRGSGEPSAPPTSLGAYLVWFLVLMFVGTVNGAFVGGVTVLARPRAVRGPSPT